MNRGGYVMSLLKNEQKEAKNYALNQMDKNMHYRWFFYIDNVELLEMQYELGNIDTKYAASILSKIYFYADQIDQAVQWAQKSEEYFKIKTRSLYTDTLITTIVDTYIQILSGKVQEKDEEQKQFYEKVVLEILDASFVMNIDFDKKLLIGLAIETDKLNFISQYIDTLNDKQLNNFFDYLTSQIHAHRNKKQIYELFLKSLQSRQDKNYNLISKCLIGLEMPKEHSNMIVDLYQKDKAMGLQIAINIEETGNFYYINKILNHISQQDQTVNYTSLVSVLSGEFREKINNKFMSQNNNVDLQHLKNIMPRWDPSNSIIANGYLMYYALALQGTKDLNPLIGEDLKKKFEKLSDWALFSTTASLGLIYPKTSEFNTKVKKLQLKEDEFTKGGELYAEGLSKFGVALNHEEQFNMMENVQNETKSEGIRHGSAMLLGLSNFQTNNVEVTEKLLVNIYGEKANIGEASGYALGLVKATHWDEDVVNNLINSSRNNQHDRISRSMMAALGLMALGNQEKVMDCYKNLIQEKFAMLRMGAVNALSMAYFNTNNNNVISQLLQIAATDLSNDVRRVAVIGIAYVMIQNQQKVLTLMSMLCKSYNNYVRHGVALALGIVGAHRFNKQYHSLLMILFEDKCFHVRQAAGIALGLVHQLSTEHIDPQLKDTIENLTKKFEQKSESSAAKMGYLWGFGLLQSGGGNSVFSVISNDGNLKLKNIVGLYLFTFYWYWYPLANMIGLTLEPTYLVGVTENLNVPRGFQFISKAPKKYFDYYKTPPKEEKKEKFAPVVLSTTKKVEARRQQNVSVIQQKVQQKKKEEEQKEKIEQEKKNDKEKQNKEEEAKFVLLNNPSRVLQKQEQFIDFNVDNKRYEVVMKNRTNGIVFLRDMQKDLPEIYVDKLPEEKHLIPPQNFIFQEEKEKE